MIKILSLKNKLLNIFEERIGQYLLDLGYLSHKKVQTIKD